jgi:hypothetical protein
MAKAEKKLWHFGYPLILASMAYLLQMNEGNFTVQNNDGDRVTLTNQHPSAIVV